MNHSFFHKLILVILAAAATAGLYEFYRTFVKGAMDAVVIDRREPGSRPAGFRRHY